jgi:RHS repeat-associated protein
MARYYHFDALGSTRTLTDQSAGTSDTYIHDAWGNEVAATGTTRNPFQWLGQLGYYCDAQSFLSYIRQRMYDPATGRFASRDPADTLSLTNALSQILDLLRGFAGSRKSIQRPEVVGNRAPYAYVDNNPVNAGDPSGLPSPIAWALILLVVGIILGILLGIAARKIGRAYDAIKARWKIQHCAAFGAGAGLISEPVVDIPDNELWEGIYVLVTFGLDWDTGVRYRKGVVTRFWTEETASGERTTYWEIWVRGEAEVGHRKTGQRAHVAAQDILARSGSFRESCCPPSPKPALEFQMEDWGFIENKQWRGSGR